MSEFALFKRFIWTIYSPYFQQKKLVVKDMANKAAVRAFLAYLLNLEQFSSLELPFVAWGSTLIKTCCVRRFLEDWPSVSKATYEVLFKYITCMCDKRCLRIFFVKTQVELCFNTWLQNQGFAHPPKTAAICQNALHSFSSSALNFHGPNYIFTYDKHIAYLSLLNSLFPELVVYPANYDPLKSVKIWHVNWIAIVIFFKRLKIGQNLFASRWKIARNNDQRIDKKLCKNEIKGSF